MQVQTFHEYISILESLTFLEIPNYVTHVPIKFFPAKSGGLVYQVIYYWIQANLHLAGFEPVYRK